MQINNDHMAPFLTQFTYSQLDHNVYVTTFFPPRKDNNNNNNNNKKFAQGILAPRLSLPFFPLPSSHLLFFDDSDDDASNVF